MYLGYNTNGMAHHALSDAIDILAEIGYRGVAITLDHAALNPWAPDLVRQVGRIDQQLRRHQLRTVVETGARFLLDPRHKHEPTLVSPRAEDRMRRVDFIKRGIDIAAELGSDCVSIWSGVVQDRTSAEVIWDRLVAGLGEILPYADQRGIDIGFEPEPGMWVDMMPQFAELSWRMDHPRLKLTLDIGHLHCQQETPIGDVVRRWADNLVNVHVEDMRRAVHEHLMFGDGDIEFPPVIEALCGVQYERGVFVELSRHSHAAVTTAQQAFDFLSRLGC